MDVETAWTIASEFFADAYGSQVVAGPEGVGTIYTSRVTLLSHVEEYFVDALLFFAN